MTQYVPPSQLVPIDEQINDVVVNNDDVALKYMFITIVLLIITIIISLFVIARKS